MFDNNGDNGDALPSYLQDDAAPAPTPPASTPSESTANPPQDTPAQ